MQCEAPLLVAQEHSSVEMHCARPKGTEPWGIAKIMGADAKNVARISGRYILSVLELWDVWCWKESRGISGRRVVYFIHLESFPMHGSCGGGIWLLVIGTWAPLYFLIVCVPEAFEDMRGVSFTLWHDNRTVAQAIRSNGSRYRRLYPVGKYCGINTISIFVGNACGISGSTDSSL